MGELRLAFLGRPQVVWDGASLAGWTLQKSLALLSYLAVTGRPHSREALAGLLWLDHTEADARASLRKVLAELRRRIPAHLTITRTEVAFDRTSEYWLDVEAFQQGIDGILAPPERRLTGTGAAALAEAMALYRGGFLLGLSVLRAPAFEEWVLLEREHLRILALRALHGLVEHHAALAQPVRTLATLDRLLALEPAQEEAHRHKMSLLALGGQRTAALRQYEACRQALRALDAEPDAQTTALYQRIRNGAELPVPRRVVAHNLHAPLTPLLGREAELAEIRARLREPACRLLTLVGPGGIGKTHLALKAAADILSDGPPAGFERGVYLVHLGSLPGVEAIVPGIAQALGLPLAEGMPPQQQVVDFLRGKQLLLLMDGFEHLPAGAGLLVELLGTVPGLKVLATSQARLNVVGEYLLPVRGLACGVPLPRRGPEGAPGDFAALASSPAVQLFVSSARQIQPGYEPADAELPDVARICHLVGKLPLAILLAASWAGMLTPTEIADELEREGGRGLDLLQAGGQDLPVRQRSMRAVFDHSWALLAARERQVLAGLAVLRGSFTLETARQVAGASLRALRALMDRSLLQRAAAGRYTMHELLRQYAEEKLVEVPGAAQEGRDRHGAYYAAALERWWGDLQGPKHQAALTEMGAENGNLCTAWDWAVERRQVAHLDRAMEGLCYFHKWLGRYEEGERLCRRAVEGLAAAAEPGREENPGPAGDPPAAEAAVRERVLARALAWQGVFCHRLGRREEARELLQHSRHRLDGLAWTGRAGSRDLPEEVQRGRAFVLWRLGNLASERDPEAAQRSYRQSLALYRALADPWGTASVLEASGRAATFSQARDGAQQAYGESLALRRAQGDDLGSYRVLSLSLATAAYQGQAEEEPGGSPVTLASALHEVGPAIAAGQFARAEFLLGERWSTDEGAGAAASADLIELVCAFNQMHLGHYERARAQTMACLARFRETGYRWGMERCCCYLAFAALATGAYDQAQQWLQESIDLCREIRQRGHLGQALALLALVARASGNLPQAKQHLGEALRVAAPVHDYETFLFQMIVVSAMALLLADDGQGERAVELYAMAARYPLVANSRLVEDLAGRQMAAVAAQLPPDAAAAALARGRARDLEAAVADLVAELGE
jgi:predicted ATPase/DNA-binding SARP family transcriptional activator